MGFALSLLISLRFFPYINSDNYFNSVNILAKNIAAFATQFKIYGFKPSIIV